VTAAVTASHEEDPPRFLQLAAHPVRWRLLRELAHSDRAVRELTERTGERQNLVSYHLHQFGRSTRPLLRHRPAALR
jgi:DNA-binding transcriptional ArsR family regulator